MATIKKPVCLNTDQPELTADWLLSDRGKRHHSIYELINDFC
jgi:hypothetical protein